MSLHTLAHHLQSAGRGDDKVLVHMTPGEVSGLQSLAMAHGGSLTVNPHTGLPEAGFLSGILPMVAGAALTAFSGGAINPMTAGLLTGAAGTVATGSLSKGLMMGLGAYGGAGLGAGLLGGAEAAAAGLGTAGAAGVAPTVSAGAMPGVVGGAGAMAPAAGGLAGTAGAAGTLPVGLQSATGMIPQTTQLPINAATNAGNAFMPTTTGGSVVATTPQTVGGPASSVESATSAWDKFKSMPGKAFDLLSGTGPEADKAREEFYKQNKGAMLASGIGFLGASREDPKQPKDPRYAVHEYDWTRRYSPSSLAPGSTAERTYFAADGGLMGLPVERMSQQNAMMDNTRYPMAFQNMPSYSVPAQRPISQNVVYPATDMDTKPYSGTETGMASGGIIALAPGGSAVAPKTTSGLFSSPFSSKINTTALSAATAKAQAEAKAAEEKAKADALKAAQDKARADAETALKKLNITEFDSSKISEPKTGWTTSGITSAYKTAADAQQKEVDNIQTLLNKYINTKTGAALKPEYSSAIEYLQGILNANKKDIEAANTAKSTALQDFSKATARGESIGTRGISAIPVPEAKPGEEKMGITDGGWGVETPAPQYQKLGYGKVTATTGWDNTVKKPYEAEDIQQVFQEVVGRKATDAEVAQYLGTPFNKGAPGTMKQLVDAINKSPDVTIARGKTNPFTDEELQANAQYYWGRKLTPGELKQFSSANYKDFGALRDALTKSNQYVDNLNKLNEAQFTKQNAPVLPAATDEDIFTTYQSLLNRYPTKEERNALQTNKSTIADIQTQIKQSDEYRNKFVQPTNVTTDGTAVTGDGTTAGGTAGGGVDMYPRGGGKGYSPPVTYGKMTDADIAQWQKDYASTTTSPYQPTQAINPQANIAGALPYRDVNKDLGLTGLYQQMAQKMPELQQGLKFTPGQGQIMASPFANVTPGLVTLQSAATPQTYTQPDLAKQGYSPAITPEEQRLMSILQSQPKNMATGGMTSYNLGGYSDGGRLLKGPGDGVSDSIPASIGDRQPARLADGEFVIPARIVSEIGNGSTDAGARKLYAMMDRVQRARRKTVGQGKVAVKSGADNMLPA